MLPLLPGLFRSDLEHLDADVCQRFLDCCSDKFAAIIGPVIGRRPARDEQVGPDRRYVFVFELPRHSQGEAFAAGLIDDRQEPELAATIGATLDEVAFPDRHDLARQILKSGRCGPRYLSWQGSGLKIRVSVVRIRPWAPLFQWVRISATRQSFLFWLPLRCCKRFAVNISI